MWVKIQGTAVEVDRGLEVLPVAEAGRRVLDPLDLRVEAFRGRVRDPMAEVGEDVVEMGLYRTRFLGQRGRQTRIRVIAPKIYCRCIRLRPGSILLGPALRSTVDLLEPRALCGCPPDLLADQLATEPTIMAGKEGAAPGVVTTATKTDRAITLRLRHPTSRVNLAVSVDRNTRQHIAQDYLGDQEDIPGPDLSHGAQSGHSRPEGRVRRALLGERQAGTLRVRL